MNICPYLQYSFHILGKKWNGLILHYLSICSEQTAHFSEIKRDIPDITPRALSMKLAELAEYGLIERKITNESPATTAYQLTEKGHALTAVLAPIQAWAKQYYTHTNEEDNDE